MMRDGNGNSYGQNEEKSQHQSEPRTILKSNEQVIVELW